MKNSRWLFLLLLPHLFLTAAWAASPKYSVQWEKVGVLRFDGNASARLCYIVKTNPAGYESQVQWTATAEGGTVSPGQGKGKAFECIVTCTDPNTFQLTVKAGNLTHKVKRASALSASDIQGRADQLPSQPFHRMLDESGVGIDEPSSGAMAYCPMPYSKGFPVALVNGEARLDVTDLYVASRGIPFIWRRTYSSLANFDSIYGFNWTTAYDRQILEVLGGVSLADGLGREDFYNPHSLGNPYAFVGNDPVNGRDPEGLDGRTEWSEKLAERFEWLRTHAKTAEEHAEREALKAIKGSRHAHGIEHRGGLAGRGGKGAGRLARGRSGQVSVKALGNMLAVEAAVIEVWSYHSCLEQNDADFDIRRANCRKEAASASRRGTCEKQIDDEFKDCMQRAQDHQTRGVSICSLRFARNGLATLTIWSELFGRIDH